MANLSTHYKERQPEQTIQIVQNFFKQYDLTLKEPEVHCTEAGTWYSHVDLYKGDQCFGGANGKGVSREYARASGHAELYERFCNGMMFVPNPYWQRLYMETNYAKYGWYWRKNEKMMSYNQWIHSCKRAEQFFSFFAKDDPELVKAYASFISKDIYFGVPMTDISGGEPLYLDPRLLLVIAHSVGMAAGNTVNEALVQGISELFEKEAMDSFLKNPNECFHALNLDLIENEKLKEIIHNIKEIGYKLYLVDLSYNYNVPVMMSVIINRDLGKISLNFGSFPVFDIAAERVLTELYQGIDTFNSKSTTLTLQIPYRQATQRDIFNAYSNAITGDFFSAEFFDGLVYEDSYNHDVYAPKESTNEELVEYYSKLAESFGNKIYYIDNSLNDEIHAVHLLMEGDNVYTNHEAYTADLDYIAKMRLINSLGNLRQINNAIYQQEKPSIPSIMDQIFPNIDNMAYFDICGEVVMWHNFTVCSNDCGGFTNLSFFVDALNMDVFFVPDKMAETIFYHPFKKYLQLVRYVKGNKYTSEEILHIMNDIFNYGITEKDIMNCLNAAYLIQKGYVEPLSQYIHSDDFKKVVDVYIENNPSL